ncbi:MAG: pyridoxamine 5'-phosphate oxidase family protein [Actinomycetia bacterium]|nr:pyridoxamine 5'-phosphate oxidase family protein [Actinomycetes bacterium]
MSTEVDLDELRRVMTGYRFAYLMTVGDEARPHAVAVVPDLTDGELLIRDPGSRTLTNALARPAVSLVWPPADIDAYSLIVDGEASEGTGELRVSPKRAVLHRPAPSPDGSGPCGSDCREISARP